MALTETVSEQEAKYRDKDQDYSILQASVEVIEAAKQRKDERPYNEVYGEISLAEESFTSAIILDNTGAGATRHVAIESLKLTIEDKERDEQGAIVFDSHANLKVEEVAVDGQIRNLEAKIVPVLFCGEIEVVTRVSPLRYFKMAILSPGKGKKKIIIRQGQLVATQGSPTLMQVVAICLAPPSILVTNGHGRQMLLLVYADVDFEAVYNLAYAIFLLWKLKLLHTFSKA